MLIKYRYKELAMALDPTTKEIIDKSTTTAKGDSKDPYKKIIEPINKTPKVEVDSTATILDSDWMTRAFMVADSDLPDGIDRNNRYWSSASVKYTDTSMGGNIGINSKPQFTRYADIRDPGRRADRTPVSVTSTGNHGMGRYYSEAIDDNSQTVYLRFGVPEFNSLGRFLSLAIDPNVSSLARTGKTKGLLYNTAKAIGTIASVVEFPVIAAVVFLGSAVGELVGVSSSKYYYMKPTMHLYWGAVNHITTTLASNLGIVPKTIAKKEDQRLGTYMKVDDKLMNDLQRLMPDIISENNYIDVYAIANRASRLATAQFMAEYQQFNDKSNTDFTGYLKKQYTTTINNPVGDHSFANYLQSLVTFGDYVDPDVNTNDMVSNTKGKVNEIEVNGTDGQKKKVGVVEDDWIGQAKKFFDAEIRDGSQFAIFKVDYTGSVNESFNNTIRDNSLSGTINEKSSSSRNLVFSLAGGNLGDNVVADAVEGVVKGAKDVASGLLEGVTLGLSNVVTALAGGGYVDIPKEWENSSSSTPRINYTTTLISPYGNPISQLQNIYLPLSMLLAGTLPLSTGKNSYTSPFLCQVFDRGRQHIKLGMIESLSITRGNSNLGFTKDGRPLALEVSFTIVDLSSVMHMPIDTGGVFGTDMTLDQDNIFYTYLNTITGLDLASEYYLFPRLKLNAAKKLASLQELKSPAYWAQVMGESTIGQMAGALVPVSPFIKDTQGVQ